MKTIKKILFCLTASLSLISYHAYSNTPLQDFLLNLWEVDQRCYHAGTGLLVGTATKFFKNCHHYYTIKNSLFYKLDNVDYKEYTRVSKLSYEKLAFESVKDKRLVIWGVLGLAGFVGISIFSKYIL